MSALLRVLCLDIEGGFGGSSRSLFESIRHMDRSAVSVEIWCRRDGPVVPRYRALGVACRVVPAMAHYSALPQFSRNLAALAHYVRSFAASRAFRRELASETNARFDRVHFNHEALFLLARWLRPRTRAPFIAHVRTNTLPSPFARWQARTLARATDAVAFITRNEEATFRSHGAKPRLARIIHNIATVPNAGATGQTGKSDTEKLTAGNSDDWINDARLRIACLSNYSYARGLDRLLDIAEELRAQGRSDVLFVVAGRMALTRSLPGLLGKIGRRGGTLADAAEARGLGGYFRFLGHIEDPDRVLALCAALIKPTREANPWGRDVIEALAAGRAVLSCGTDSTFVETGVTGYLQERFDAAAMAREIMRLADDRESLRRMGEMGKARVASLCDGPARARDLLDLWREAARP
ncbi:MAG: glycosyltransferase family 4 protein [Alphaproteobacteria bacterium]